MMFNIISAEEFETDYGTIKKGDVINTLHFESKDECNEWVYENYGPMGENIKVKIKEVRQ